MAPVEVQLREELNVQRQINVELDTQIRRQQATIEKLQRQMEQMIRQLYGRRSEKLDRDQLLMEAMILAGEGEGVMLEQAVAPAEPSAAARPERKPNGRRPIPDHLKRNEIVLDVSEEEKICPTTGQSRPFLGYEESEKLTYVPETLEVNVYKRAKYGSPNGAEENGVLTAPLRPALIDRCLADSGMLAHVAVSKFDDHIPLNRLEKMLGRQGVSVSRKTMCGWLAALADGLKPLEQRIKEHLLNGPVIHHDDTPAKLLDPGAGKTREARFWVAVSGNGPPLVHFSFSRDRKQEHPIAFFRGYGGAVMCDEYAGYTNIACGTLQSCWAHARRYVENAKDIEPAFATEVLLEIAKLYRLEKELKEAPAEYRGAERQARGRPQLGRIFGLLESREFRPASPMQKARQYILKNRKSLSAYVEDGRLPIDNNPAERAIRRVAIGRKNWLFLGSETGGETAAILMTFLGSCSAHHINPFAYLKDVIERLPTCHEDQFDELLPHTWIESHPDARLPAQS